MVEPNREEIAKQRKKRKKCSHHVNIHCIIYIYIHSYRIHELKPRNKTLSSSVQLETGQIKAKHILTCSYDVNITGAEQFHKKAINDNLKIDFFLIELRISRLVNDTCKKYCQ